MTKRINLIVTQYADTVLNILDKNKRIKHRLYRHHAVITSNPTALHKVELDNHGF